jgi:hypothetical protein
MTEKTRAGPRTNFNCMNQTIIPTTTIATFVLRFWYETNEGERRLRGCIEHVQSGTNVAFMELGAIMSFLRRFGISEEHQNQP